MLRIPSLPLPSIYRRHRNSNSRAPSIRLTVIAPPLAPTFRMGGSRSSQDDDRTLEGGTATATTAKPEQDLHPAFYIAYVPISVPLFKGRLAYAPQTMDCPNKWILASAKFSKRLP